MVAENSNDRKLSGTEFYFTNLAADICLPKMVAELLSHPKRQFHPPENNRHSFFLYYENSRGQFTIENASRITLHRADIYRNQPFGAPVRCHAINSNEYILLICQ